MKITAKLWIGLTVLAVLSPLGLIIPAYFKAGSAWGEWGAEEMQKLVGYVPQGLRKLSGSWNAPLPDYSFPGWENRGAGHAGAAYVISAFAGIVIIVLAVLFLGRLLAKKGG